MTRLLNHLSPLEIEALALARRDADNEYQARLDAVIETGERLEPNRDDPRGPK